MIIGITGSFGSGKSTVARIFKLFGARVIDADRIARSLLAPQTKIYKKIVSTFGLSILKNNRTIDRAKLAAAVFNNKRRLNSLNNIVHPEVIRIIKSRIKIKGEKAVIIDAPLLIEAGLAPLADYLIVVALDRKTQINRLRGRTVMDRADILKRIRAQMPLSDKVRMADFVIDNSGTREFTKKQARSIWEAIRLAGKSKIIKK